MNNRYSKHTKYEDFPVGTKVKNVSYCVDFTFFHGDEKGVVVENEGSYLGIIVSFDKPLVFGNGSKLKKFNFEPRNLKKRK